MILSEHHFDTYPYFAQEISDNIEGWNTGWRGEWGWPVVAKRYPWKPAQSVSLSNQNCNPWKKTLENLPNVTQRSSQSCPQSQCWLRLPQTFPTSQGQVWTSCKRWSLEWAAPTGTQPYTVFGYKDFCGSTVLGTPESVGMNRQIDWQALQISHLVCSLAGQRCSEAWGTFSARTSQSITALTAWRKEEWRKEAADIPPSKAENDLCSTRQILALFRGQPWGDC